MQTNTNMQNQNQTRRSRQAAGHRNNGNRHMADELMGMLDEHVAWNAARQRARPTSAGTMIVDWDGTGVPVVSYRKDEPDIIPQVQPGRIVEASKAIVSKNQGEREHTVQPPSQTHTQASQAKSRQRLKEVDQTIQFLQPSTAQVPSRVPTGHVPGNYKSLRDTPYSQPERTSRGLPQTPSSMRRKPVPQRPRAPNPLSRRDPLITSASAPSRAPERSQARAHHHHHSAQEPQHAPIPPRARSLSTAVHIHHSPPPQNLSVHYTPTHNTVRGYDTSTAFSYEYNGQIVHIHRSPTQSTASRYSEYYDVPAETYSATAPVEVVNKELPALPRASLTQDTTKRDKVVRFVKVLLRKLDGMGVLGRMRQEREKKKVEMGRRREGMDTCF